MYHLVSDYPEVEAEYKLYQVGMYTEEEYIDVLNYHLLESVENIAKTKAIISELERMIDLN